MKFGRTLSLTPGSGDTVIASTFHNTNAFLSMASGTIMLISIRTGAVFNSFSIGTPAADCLMVIDDGTNGHTYLATGNDSTQVCHSAVDYASGTILASTTQDFVSILGKAQQGASFISSPSTNEAMFCGFTAGTLVRLNLTGGSTTYTPTGLTAGGNCICTYVHNDSFLVGSRNGKVFEITQTGGVTTSVTLPTTPNSGTAPTLVVTSIQVISGTIILVACQTGMIYMYDWSTGTLLDQFMASAGAGTRTTGPLMSPVVNNLVLIGSENNPGMLSLWDVTPGQPVMQTDEIMTGSSGNITGLHLAGSYGAVLVGNDLITFEIIGSSTISVTTRAQNPIGTDVTQRVIRIARPSLGRGRLQYDNSAGAGLQSISCQNQGIEYYEISDLAGGTEKADVRRFTA